MNIKVQGKLMQRGKEYLIMTEDSNTYDLSESLNNIYMNHKNSVIDINITTKRRDFNAKGLLFMDKVYQGLYGYYIGENGYEDKNYRDKCECLSDYLFDHVGYLVDLDIEVCN